MACPLKCLHFNCYLYSTFLNCIIYGNVLFWRQTMATSLWTGRTGPLKWGLDQIFSQTLKKHHTSDFYLIIFFFKHFQIVTFMSGEDPRGKWGNVSHNSLLNKDTFELHHKIQFWIKICLTFWRRIHLNSHFWIKVHYSWVPSDLLVSCV